MVNDVMGGYYAKLVLVTAVDFCGNLMNKKIIIAAGGTGGHIFPGLALAEELISQKHQVVWVGSNKGMEAKLIPKYNLKIYYINVGGIRGKNWFTKILSGYYVIIAIFQSLKILYREDPDLVLGMGGFVSGPVGIAAWLLRKKLVIHEQNAIAGTTNRLLALFADRILESFPNSFRHNFIKSNYYLHKVILTGVPVRKDLLLMQKNNINFNKSAKFKILVLGGSRGAKFLNQIIPTALVGIDDIHIIHQTGEQDLISTRNLYLSFNYNHTHKIISFIDNISEIYNLVDIVICRAGASTIFEILASGAASILVPLPWAIDDHQTKNALYLSENNAAILINQNDLTAEQLKELIIDLIHNPSKIDSLKEAARSLYKRYKFNYNSAKEISEIIIDV